MKVCIVGGGSTYTPELLEGLLLRAARLDLAEVWLTDVDDERLAVLGPLARRMADKAVDEGCPPVRIEWSTDRRRALAGSAFVVSQIRVGGMEARARDEQLGREFGLVGQETVGVGGLANAFRTVPVALDIATDIAAEARDAVLLNFTNPAGLVTEALARNASVDVVGLCNVPWTVRARVARDLDVDAALVDLESVGLNHLSWFRRVVVDGQDRTDEVLARLVERRSRRAPSDDPTAEPDWTPEEFADIGAIPNPYLRYYHQPARWVARQELVPSRASEVARLEAALLRQYADPALDRKPPELTQRGGAFYSEAAAELMVDLVEARRGVASGRVHVVDVPAAGAVPGLADHVVVEVAVEIGPDGPRPRPVAPLRPDIAALVTAVKRAEVLAIDAAVTCDVDTAVEALLAHPLGPDDRSTARAVWRRLREMNEPWVGNWTGR